MGRYAELQKAWDENREEFRRLHGFGMLHCRLPDPVHLRSVAFPHHL